MRCHHLPLFALLIGLLASCGGSDHRIWGTDIPLVPGTTLTGNTFETSRGRVQSGTATFTGSIFDALERARWTERGFEIDGWTLASINGTPEEATAVFTQAVAGTDTQRVATLHVVASQVRGTATMAIDIQPKGKVAASEQGASTGSDEGAGAE